MDYSPPSSSVHGISQARRPEWVAISPGDLPNPGIETGSPVLQENSCAAHGFFTKWATVQFSSVQSLSRVWLFAASWTVTRQASLSITNSRSLLKLMSIESVMPSNLCRPLLLPPSIFPSIRVFSSESVFLIKWPKYWSFSFSISPSNEKSGLISFRMDSLDLLTSWYLKFPGSSGPCPLSQINMQLQKSVLMQLILKQCKS